MTYRTGRDCSGILDGGEKEELAQGGTTLETGAAEGCQLTGDWQSKSGNLKSKKENPDFFLNTFSV